MRVNPGATPDAIARRPQARARSPEHDHRRPGAGFETVWRRVGESHRGVADSRGIGRLYVSGGGVRWGVLDPNMPGAFVFQSALKRILPAQPWHSLWPRTAT